MSFIKCMVLQLYNNVLAVHAQSTIELNHNFYSEIAKNAVACVTSHH